MMGRYQSVLKHSIHTNNYGGVFVMLSAGQSAFPEDKPPNKSDDYQSNDDMNINKIIIDQIMGY